MGIYAKVICRSRKSPPLMQSMLYYYKHYFLSIFIGGKREPISVLETIGGNTSNDNIQSEGTLSTLA